MAPQILFETPRVRARRLDSSDIPGLHEVYGDLKVVRFVDDGQAISLADCERWIDVTDRNYEARGYGMSAIESTSTGELLGFCGLVHPRGQEKPEIKYAYKPSVWGSGIATEVAKAMLQYGIRQHAMTEIIATVDPQNIASQRVLTKAGLRSCETIENDGEETRVFRWRADGCYSTSNDAPSGATES